MRMKLTYVFLISCLCVVATSWSQQSTVVKPKDTIRLNNSYGLRVGLDLQNIVTSLTNSNFQGIELMGDYRLSHKYFLAAEIGNQERTDNELSVSTTAKGSYIKAGVDVNVYKNLVGLRNIIFIGLRYGFASYSQELNRFSVATSENFFGIDTRDSENDRLRDEGLSAHWLEVLGGVKVEVVNNVFVGFSVSIRRKIAEQDPEGFGSLFIPGFERTNDFGEVSAGYRFFVSYFIPLYKRNKKIKSKKEITEENN